VARYPKAPEKKNPELKNLADFKSAFGRGAFM
jgi:hypothetical protein